MLRTQARGVESDLVGHGEMRSFFPVKEHRSPLELNDDGQPTMTDCLEIEDDAPLIDESAQADYRTWKKNTPFLYDYLSTHPLLWPSLSVNFFPDLHTTSAVAADDLQQQLHQQQLSLQRIVLGTYTQGQATDTLSIVSLPMFTNIRPTVSSVDYNPEKQEFEVAQSSYPKLKVLQQISHRGDVNCIRYMPQKPNILATANNLGNISIYERTKHSNLKRYLLEHDSELATPQLRLEGRTSVPASDVFAIDWNLRQEGLLVSASMAGDINVFDIQKNYNSSTSVIAETHYFSNDSVGVNNVEWISQHDSVFVLGDEAGFIKVYDIRTPEHPVSRQQAASSTSINAVAVNPFNPSAIASGNEMGDIAIWDLRAMGHVKALPTVEYRSAHSDAITLLKWNRTHPNIVASSSQDKRVCISDVSLTQSKAPIFVHAGHMLGVTDLDWSHHDPWLVASVSADNSLHVWRPAHPVVAGYVSG